MEVFYDKIKEIRKKQKLTILEFCEKAGIGRATLWTWEKGKQTPSAKKIESMADALNVPISEISSLPPKKEVSEAKLSETVNSWLHLSSPGIKEKILEHENIIKRIRNQQTELVQASVLIKAMMSTIQSYFYIKDNNLKYLIANDVFLKNSSLNTNYKVNGKDDFSFFPYNEAVKNAKQDQEVLRSGQAIIKHEDYIPGSRKRKWGLISKFPLFDSNDKVTGVVGTFIDLTEQKKLEEDKRKLKIRSMLEASFSTPYEILWLISYKPKREYLYISNSIEKMLGYSVENFYRDKDFWLNNCVHPDYRREQYKYTLNGECPEQMEYKLINSKGETVWVEEFTFKETFENKKCIGFITRDITARKKKNKFLAENVKMNIINNLQENHINGNILQLIKSMSLSDI